MKRKIGAEYLKALIGFLTKLTNYFWKSLLSKFVVKIAHESMLTFIEVVRNQGQHTQAIIFLDL